jgi:hypothetical protein
LSQIASDAEEKLKSFTGSGGAETAESSVSPPRVRSVGPIASTLARTATLHSHDAVVGLRPRQQPRVSICLIRCASALGFYQAGNLRPFPSSEYSPFKVADPRIFTSKAAPWRPRF